MTDPAKKRDQRGPIDTAFLIIVLVLTCIGLIMMFSASYANAFYLKSNSLHYISRQLGFAIVGVAVMLGVSRVDYGILRLLAIPTYLVSLVLLVVVLFMRPLNGARRWIILGPINFQPSEIAKFAVVILSAAYITAYYQKMKTFRHGILPFLVGLTPIVLLMLKEPHLSGTVLILSLGIAMMFMGGCDAKWFVAGGIVAVGGIALVVVNPTLLTTLAHYAGERITVWLDPFSDPLDGGFQTLQSLYAIGSGGVMGAGIGGSRQKYLYLPEPQNDFVFSIVCEELGFVGAVLILCIFVLLVWRGFVIAVRCTDRFGSLVAAGLVCQVGLQTILNIAVITNTIPNTGIPLPF
ncbi:MAG: putative peptidoglycan glycosyltransferase FtsW, partial [Oscillospiraceae bacterium]